MRFCKFIWFLSLLAALSCARQMRPAVTLQTGERELRIPGLDACNENGPGSKALDPSRPLVIIVHGCRGSGGRFRALAQVFEAHGQQAICFNYNDREKMDATSARLAWAIEKLIPELRPAEITILGHSQGGLVARRALVQQKADGISAAANVNLKLVTVSSPFGGIAASSDCSRVGLHIATLGLTVAICHAVAGAKWSEIHPRSDFVNQPGTLSAYVSRYIKIVTDERDSCRRYEENNKCIEDDFVFSMAEQYNRVVDIGTRVENRVIRAGHVEIVGGPDTPPLKLITSLQKNGILMPTPAERQREISLLLAAIYGSF